MNLDVPKHIFHIDTFANAICFSSVIRIRLRRSSDLPYNFSRHSSKTILFPRITTIPHSSCDATSTVSSNTKFLLKEETGKRGKERGKKRHC